MKTGTVRLLWCIRELQTVAAGLTNHHVFGRPGPVQFWGKFDHYTVRLQKPSVEYIQHLKIGNRKREMMQANIVFAVKRRSCFRVGYHSVRKISPSITNFEG